MEYKVEFTIESDRELSVEEIGALEDALIEKAESLDLFVGGGIRPVTKLDNFMDSLYIFLLRHFRFLVR